MELQINTDTKRFEMQVNDDLIFVEYILVQEKKIYLTHTEVPKHLEGQGLASKLVKEVLEYIKEQQLELIPLCPFVAAYLKRNPAYQTLLVDGINIE